MRKDLNKMKSVVDVGGSRGQAMKVQFAAFSTKAQRRSWTEGRATKHAESI